MDLELERTFLVRRLPIEVSSVTPTEILDIYFPPAAAHPTLRLRQRGERYEMTKKTHHNGADASEQEEDTIRLSAEEFAALSQAAGKRVRKQRYTYKEGRVTVEVDVFADELEGLVQVDFEFATTEEKKAFTPPEWCLAEVTQDAAMAGGMLAGKGYSDIEEALAKYGYKK